MTDTTASSDAKQSQPAASLSGSELDRLRELAERGKAADWGWVRADPLAILALLAERQQDRQRIADLEEAAVHAFRFVNAAIDKAASGDSAESDLLEAHHALQDILAELRRQAQPSSGGDDT